MMKLRKLFPSTVLFLLHVAVASATLTIYQGRVTVDGASTTQVEGVAVLNLGGTAMLSHLFDCSANGSNLDLIWEKDEGNQRFPTPKTSIVLPPELDGGVISVLRMDMGPTANTEPVDYDDVGVYTCENTRTGERVSINITGGNAAVNPVEANKDVIVGRTTVLNIYVAGDPVLASHEIIWRAPSGDAITGSDPKLALVNANRRLVIENVELEDSGSYRIDIVREIAVAVFRTYASTNIDLNVQVTPVTLSSPMSEIALEHDDITFTCAFSGNPPPSITWEREGTASLPVGMIVYRSMMNESVSLYTVTSVFSINGVAYDDEGRYRCEATNALVGGVQGAASTTFAELIVTPRIRLSASSPAVISDGGLVHVVEDTRVEIRCSGSGNLIWNSSSGVDIRVITGSTEGHLSQRNDPTKIPNEQTLFIVGFTPADRAVYTCSSDLSVDGNTFAESVLVTDADPAAYIAESTIYAAQGSDAQITATAYSSMQNSLVIQWYLDGNLIDTNSNPRYSVEVIGTDTYVLNIMNVGMDVIGRYNAVAIVANANQSDSVELVFPNPPTVSIVPQSSVVFESQNVSIQCLAGGTQPNAVWMQTGGQPLPNGVFQMGNDLVIDQATRSHAGLYECTVTNSAGMQVARTATLTVNYVPTVTITHEETRETSINQVLDVILEQGDPALTFSCSSDGSPPPTLTWGGPGGMALPTEVSRQTISNRESLVWSRPLQYTDSGQYMCTGANTVGTGQARLDLLVRRLPTITSVFSNSPVSSNYTVPVGYSGTVVTCAALGWPTPSIQWLRNGQTLIGRIFSDSFVRENSAFVSARLRWREGFLESDAGNYTCVVRDNDTDTTQSKVILLGSNPGIPPTQPTLTCSVDSQEIYFQLRLLDTDCLTWEEDLRLHIASGFLTELMNVVVAECRDCTIAPNNIEITDGPTCSNDVARAAVFRGRITTDRASQTEDLFCALSRWQQSRPMISVNGNFRLVDEECSIELDSPSSTGECSPPRTGSLSISLPELLAGVAGGVITLLVITISFCIFCICCMCRRNKKEEKKIPNSHYERTCHTDIGADLTRYTDRVDPELKASVNKTHTSCEEENHVYSTLVQSEVYPPPQSENYPPPPPPNFPLHTSREMEMTATRKTSRSLLLSDFDNQPTNMTFQIIQEGVTVVTPEPYQMAVSSQENINDAPDSVEQYNTTQRIRGSVNNQKINQKIRLNHTLSTGAASPSDQVVSATSPVATYEQIDNFTSSSSGDKRGTPTRVLSSGHVRENKPHEGGFRRHMSAIESSRRDSTEDYAHLNRGESSVQRGRAQSNTPLQPLPHPEKRRNVTNYSRNSPSPSDSQDSFSLTMRNTEVFTPTSEAPPPYRETLSSVSSPYSPSGSSMLENGAYEGVDPQTQAAMHRESLDEQQQWYHNASDFSLPENDHHHQQQQNDAVPTRTPYQVSNYEMDGCRLEGGSVARIHASENTPLPYPQPVKNNNVGSLSRMHQRSHFHTVVV